MTQNQETIDLQELAQRAIRIAQGDEKAREAQVHHEETRFDFNGASGAIIPDPTGANAGMLAVTEDSPTGPEETRALEALGALIGYPLNPPEDSVWDDMDMNLYHLVRRDIPREPSVPQLLKNLQQALELTVATGLAMAKSSNTDNATFYAISSAAAALEQASNHLKAGSMTPAKE